MQIRGICLRSVAPPGNHADKVHLHQVSSRQAGTQADKAFSLQVSRTPPGIEVGRLQLLQVGGVQPGAQVFPVKGREDERSEMEVDVQGEEDELTNENTPSGQALAQAQGVLSSGEQRCARSVAVPFQAQAIRAEAGSKELAQLANQDGSLVPSCMPGVGAISVDVSKSELLGFRSTSPCLETGRSGPCEVPPARKVRSRRIRSGYLDRRSPDKSERF